VDSADQVGQVRLRNGVPREKKKKSSTEKNKEEVQGQIEDKNPCNLNTLKKRPESVQGDSTAKLGGVPPVEFYSSMEHQQESVGGALAYGKTNPDAMAR